jgi:hypothetical protein
MRAELKHIARPGGGGCAGGRGQRTPLVGLRFAANDDLVDFAESEAEISIGASASVYPSNSILSSLTSRLTASRSRRCSSPRRWSIRTQGARPRPRTLAPSSQTSLTRTTLFY